MSVNDTTSSSKQPVIVFGKERYNTLGAIRSLGQHNVPVFLISLKSSSPSFCRLSKYIAGSIIVNEVDEGIQYLLKNHQTRTSSKTVIVPTDDLVASKLDQHYQMLKDCYIFPNALGRLTEVMDKDVMTRMAESSGLAVPKTVKYVCGDPLPNYIAFPCMVKPAKSITGSKTEMRICHDLDELREAVSYQEKGHQLLLQQYINKEYEPLLLGCRCPNGKVFLAGVFKKQRWFSMGNDGSFGLITSDYGQWFDKKKIESFLEKLDYIGPFGIEFGVEKGTPYFYEINLRNDGTSHYFDATGFCNLYTWVMECKGVSMEQHSKGEYWFIDEFGDFMNVVDRNISWKQWRKDRKKATALKYTNKLDPKPMIIIRPYMYLFVFKRALKLLRNKRKE